MRKNRDEIIDYLKGIQLHYLKVGLGANYKSTLNNLNDKYKFDLFIDKYFYDKNDLTEDDKIDVEVELKNSLFTSNCLSTEYESFAHWNILNACYDKFKSFHSEFNQNDELYFGTILSNEVNAEARYIDELGITFILFDGELMNAALQLSKIISQSLPLNYESPHLKFPISLEELQKRIVFNTTIRERIIGGLYFSIYKRPTDFTAYLLNDELLEYISYQLLEGIEYYIFSHEVGHYLNGHLLEESEKPTTSVSEMKKEWLDEFESDLFGLNQLIKLYEANERNKFTLLGPEIFFNFLILREKYNNKIKDDSHPPASTRLAHHRMLLKNFLSDDDFQEFIKYQGIIDSLFKYYEIVVNDFVKFNIEFQKTNIKNEN